MKHILLIDTSYFAHRVLGQLNMNENVNNLETENEKRRFVNELQNSLVNLYQTFNNEKHSLIDQIVLCCDNYSWRKDIEPVRPYWLTDTEVPLGYKEQRIEKKEESPIHYENLYPLVDEFLENVKDTVVVLKIKGLEGDDTMMFMSRQIAEHKDCNGIILCTDGDIEQLVNDSVIIMKNTRSKQSPNGEFVMNLNTYTKLFEQDAMQQMLGNNVEKKYYQDLFGICIGNIDGSTTIKRTLNAGISIATPFRTILLKSIGGDKKDNIFSTISWLSSTGTRLYKITEKHLEKAFAANGLCLTENDCKKVFTDAALTRKILESLKIVTKQTSLDIESIIPHLKHNIRLNLLSPNSVPQKLQLEFGEWFNVNKEAIFESNINEEKMRSLFVQQNYTPKENKGINVLEQSLENLL